MMRKRIWSLAVVVTLLALLGLTTLQSLTALARQDVNPNAAGISAVNSLNGQDRQDLMAIARDTWKFYGYDADIDPNTDLPRDNIGFYGAPAQGNYTSPTNIGLYLWSIVAANDMQLINRPEAFTRINRLITTVEKLRKYQGFLLSWYNTTNGHCMIDPSNPNSDCDNGPITGQLISTVDNGWFGAGLVVARSFLGETQSKEAVNLRQRVSALLEAMNYGLFYDKGNQCADITAGQMYGGYLADVGPAGFHYGVLNTETRIAAYMGIGTHTMPGDVWWRTWRTLPSAKATPPPTPTGCAMDTADFDWQGQYPPKGTWTTYNDPYSQKPFTLFEGHYVYNGIDFAPSWGGSMFEGLMPNLVVPETSWGPRSFGLNDFNYSLVNQQWPLKGLGFPVWGLSPSSTPDDTGNYDAFGSVGPAYPNAIASNANCCPYSQYAVTPHASFLTLDTTPHAALANIMRLRQLYPDIYGPYGFFDAVAPKATSYSMNGKTFNLNSGQVGHRYLVLDQSMIFAALDNALENRAMQRHFATDPVGMAVKPYLQIEAFSIKRAGEENNN